VVGDRHLRRAAVTSLLLAFAVQIRKLTGDRPRGPRTPAGVSVEALPSLLLTVPLFGVGVVRLPALRANERSAGVLANRRAGVVAAGAVLS
jgi:hypothetical protein